MIHFSRLFERNYATGWNKETLKSADIFFSGTAIS